MALPPEVRRDLLARMSRIEGQARGVKAMIDEGRDCAEVVHQIAAIRAALAQVGAAIVAANLEECVRQGLAGDDAALRQARRTLLDLV
jgi:DNA-binding FrmR family transcriptional regulator